MPVLAEPMPVVERTPVEVESMALLIPAGPRAPEVAVVEE
jgi:hypothetical protein